MAQVTGTYQRAEGANEPWALDAISTETPRVQAKAVMLTSFKRGRDHRVSRGRHMGRRAVTVHPHPPTRRHESSGYQAAAAVAGCP
jgi:hypothetical protein